MKYIFYVLAVCAILTSCDQKSSEPSVLIFSKTEGYRHKSIEPGIEAIKKLGRENGFKVRHSEDATIIREDSLKNYHAVIFLNTTGDIFDDIQQYEFQRYYQAGGGFVGIHAAADTEYDWPWYGELVGGYFNGHPSNPNVRNADIIVQDSTHLACDHLPQVWNRDDEWYNYKNLNPDMKILLNLDENSYEGGTNGESHPIAWTREHMFYTGLGHTEESFTEDLFLKHILGGIKSVMGDLPDYDGVAVAPALNRFQKVVLDQNLDEPMELVVLPNEDIIFIQRKGEVRYYSREKRLTKKINQIDVHTEFEDGLLGIALDPRFGENQWIYLFYSPNIEESVQHVSRFDFIDGKIDLTSEKVILKIPVQREKCCHSAGSIEFDKEGNLFISTGDDTNPFESSGYSPSDGREGRKPFDARRSSANTNDLRGKILRITPQEDGSYTIPDGNLFPATDSSLAEIYVMGCRNPFRFHVDSKSGFLYWGDVGPDAGEDRENRGPRGHDEINQAKTPGFHGWPLFIADNKPYHKYNFKTTVSGEEYNPTRPINDSPNNTGKSILPEAREAFVYYPYASSEEFPLVKEGGRNAMAGFVYHYDDYPESENKLPRYYDGKLFIYDWMRGWFMAVAMDEEGDYVSMERFLPNHKFSNPTDVFIDNKGEIYLLEYGTAWFSQNMDARLVHLKFSGGNRPPMPSLEVEKTMGAAPLTLSFDASESLDYDGDKIEYLWKIGDKKIGSGPELNHTFEEPGNYIVRLEAEDRFGGSNFEEIQIVVGNEKPQVEIEIAGNSSFYFDGEPIVYEVKVSDQEDGSIGKGIDPSMVAVNIDYLEKGFDKNEIALGHMSSIASHPGMKAMRNSDCYTCHKDMQKSIGPNFLAVANKYRDDKSAPAYLAERIIKGGGGVWGEQAMAAHPQLDEDEVAVMVEYILDIEEVKDMDALQVKGSYRTQIPEGKESGGVFIMNATYIDQGAPKADPISTTETKYFRNSVLSGLDYDEMQDVMKFDIEPGQVPGVTEKMSILIANHESHIMFKDIDFSNIKNIEVSTMVNSDYVAGGSVELVLDEMDDAAFAVVEPAKSDLLKPSIDLVPVNGITGVHDLYVRFKSDDPMKAAMVLNYLEFKK